MKKQQLEQLLSLQIEREDIQAAAELLSQNPTTIQSQSYYYLHIASRKGNLDLLTFLINKSSPLNQTNKLGQTALYVAVYNNHLFIVKKLLKEGSDCNICDIKSISPLMVACQKGFEKMVHLLLQNEADPYKSNKQGQQCLDLCRNQALKEILRSYFRATKQGSSQKKHSVLLASPSKFQTQFETQQSIHKDKQTSDQYRYLSQNNSQLDHSQDLNINGDKQENLQFMKADFIAQYEKFIKQTQQSFDEALKYFTQDQINSNQFRDKFSFQKDPIYSKMLEHILKSTEQTTKEQYTPLHQKNQVFLNGRLLNTICSQNISLNNSLINQFGKENNTAQVQAQAQAQHKGLSGSHSPKRQMILQRDITATFESKIHNITITDIDLDTEQQNGPFDILRRLENLNEMMGDRLNIKK